MTRYHDDPLKRHGDGYEMNDAQYIKWVGYTSGVDNTLNYIGCLHPETTLADVITEVQKAMGKGVI